MNQDLNQENMPQPLKVEAPLKGNYLRILRYLKPYRLIFGSALVLMVLFGATDGGVPFLVKYVLDGVFATHDKNLLKILPLALVMFACVRALCDFGQQFLASKVGHYVVRDIRNEINAHLLKLPPDFFIKNGSANLISRITSDVLLVRTLLTDSVAAILRDSIRVIALLISAIYLDPTLAAIAFIAFPIGILPVYKYGRKMRRLSKRGQEAIGSLSGLMQESILGNRVVKIFTREDFEKERFERENHLLTRTFVSSEKVRALTGPINEVLASFAISGVILYGGWSVIGGTRSQGDFIAFLISVFLLYDPFKKLSRVSGSVQQAMAGAERIFEVLDIVPAIQDPQMPRTLGARNNIEFEQVEFSYRAGEIKVLSDISLVIPEGQKVAIVGFSGAGKSTLVDLLPRFIDPTKGRVLIGGTDVSTVSLLELRKRVAMVGQHTFLFNDTIYNNIAYGAPQATKEEIYAAARAAYALDFISALPQGFDTKIGEAGFSLSGGERQRIAIARAILKKAPILVLDEATASLDNRSEREVQSAIEELEKGKTSVVIAHRLSTVRNADLIVVLRDGQIVEKGTHTELLKNASGEYSKLHALQFAPQNDKSKVEDAVIN